ncbi:hypothetical protein ACRALDRAFT_1066305 [Sodiomyces alcalophilus JCM 7366]|uniref:uncharacterized protein n=1 Tax=Sodiomyces alcalophilus JCM 7366 TaxID=591952 RepID=UPI0039B6B61C
MSVQDSRLDSQLAQDRPHRLSVPEPVLTQQPSRHQGMELQKPSQSTSDEPELKLRGGRNGEMCPGRFCFIIPCPLPCNFCVFPCPC